MVVAAASNVGSKVDSPVSARIEEKHTLDVAGEALIARYTNEGFLVGDIPGGLALEDSVPKAKDFMRKKCQSFFS